MELKNTKYTKLWDKFYFLNFDKMTKIDKIYVHDKCIKLLSYSLESDWSAKELVNEM